MFSRKLLAGLSVLPALAHAAATDCSKSAGSWLECSESQARRVLGTPVAAGNDCGAWAQSVRRQDAQWFLDHLSAFRELDRSLVKTTQETAARIESLNTDEKGFFLEPTEAQKERIAINFKTLDEYARAFNSRFGSLAALDANLVLKTIREMKPSDQLETVKSPITFQQFFDGVALVSRSLNSSLGLAPAEFRLVAEEKFPLEIRLQIAANLPGKRVMFSIALTDFPKSKFTPTEAEKWNAILATTIRVDGKPADGRLRLRHFRDQSARPDCAMPVYVTADRLPYDPMDVAGTFEAPAYQSRNLKELGSLKQPVESVSISATGEVLATTAGPDHSGFSAKVDSGVWSEAVSGMSRPVQFGASRVLAVGPNGAVFSEEGSGWKKAIEPYVLSISVAGGTVFGLDMDSRLVRGGIGQSWKPMRSYITFRAISALDASTVYGLASDGWNVMKIDANGTSVAGQAPADLVKLQAVSPDSWIGLGRDGKLYHWTSAGVVAAAISDTAFSDVAANGDGVLCAVRRDNGRVVCLR